MNKQIDSGSLKLSAMLGVTLTDNNRVGFDLDEIDDLLYMFNRYCSGTVHFAFSDKIAKHGKVYLNGKEHSDWEIIKITDELHSVLAVKLRGYLTEYGSKATLIIEGFESESGNILESTDFTVEVNTKRCERSDKYAEHDKVAERIAKEAIVLLENNGVLPLKNGETLNLFGEGVSNFRFSSVGAARVNVRCIRSVEEAVLESSPFKLNTEIYDEIITVSDEDAFATGKLIGQKEGFLVGISSGAAAWAAIELAKKPENAGKTIVVLLPDTGDRYLSTPMFE